MAIKQVERGGPAHSLGRTTSSVVLPTVKSKPSQNLADFLIFIYGEKKIGKTTFASNFPNALHLFFEPGGKGLETYAVEMSGWADFLKILELLATDAGDPFENVVVDTVDLAYNMCFEFVCKREFMEHPSDNNDFGKSWGLIKKEFVDRMTALTKLGKGVVLLSHAKESEIKTRMHGVWTKIIPSLPNQAVEFITGAADMNAYYGYYGGERRLVIDGSDNIEAGCRLKYNFRTPTGEKIVSIPMGNSDEEAYENVLLAFNNGQEETGEEVHGQWSEMTDRGATLKAARKKAE